MRDPKLKEHSMSKKDIVRLKPIILWSTWTKQANSFWMIPNLRCRMSQGKSHVTIMNTDGMMYAICFSALNRCAIGD